ncbi:MAG: LON peptidase substrate-binding domain-containing protein, partial [Candidatus Zixiibacteriota bacterium]
MIIESKKNLPLEISDKEEIYPVLPLRSGVLFPEMTLIIQVARPENLALINHCHSGKKKFISVYSTVEASEVELSKIPLFQVGVLTQIGEIRQGPKDYKTVLLEGFERIALIRKVETKPFITAVGSKLKTEQKITETIKEMAEKALASVSEITNLDPSYSSEQLVLFKSSLNDPGLLADAITASFRLPLTSKQEILETIDIEQRLEILQWLLEEELSKIKTRQSIDENVKKTVKRKREQEILKEELVEIKKRLGEDFTEEKESERIKMLIRSMPELPPEVVSRATIEADRLSQLSSASAEYGVTKNYLDWVLSLPWGRFAPEIY